MKKTIALAAVLAGLAACQGAAEKTAVPTDSVTSTATIAAAPVAENTLTDQEKADGWMLLYDGTSKSGWHVWHSKSDGSAWKADSGTLRLDPKGTKDWQTIGGGDLVTDSAFTNFHFSVEWKVADSGNSGIIFLVQEDAKYEHTWHTGPEMQVLDNNGHPDAKIIKHRAGDLYDLISSAKETVKKAGEWNKAEVIYNKGALDLILNGEKVVSTRLDDESWKKLKAGSKFKDQPGFGAFTSGHIALQDHGNKVWYRNVKIKKIV
ncbi:MAG: DUF1080 domain-containing protein [Sphingobacteriales bacterium]|jgi:uncharacterized protein YaiE (UPF0345 family)